MNVAERSDERVHDDHAPRSGDVRDWLGRWPDAELAGVKRASAVTHNGRHHGCDVKRVQSRPGREKELFVASAIRAS